MHGPQQPAIAMPTLDQGASAFKSVPEPCLLRTGFGHLEAWNNTTGNELSGMPPRPSLAQGPLRLAVPIISSCHAPCRERNFGMMKLTVSQIQGTGAGACYSLAMSNLEGLGAAFQTAVDTAGPGRCSVGLGIPQFGPPDARQISDSNGQLLCQPSPTCYLELCSCIM